MDQSHNLKSSVCLSLTALIWGVAFVFQSMGNLYMELFTFNAARNLLGCVALLPLVIHRTSRYRRAGQPIHIKIILIGGVCCGLALAAAGMFQQYGVKYTTVGKAGFITTLYIILTPILGLFLKKKCRFTVWIGTAGALTGLYMLCITDGLTLSLGDALVFICAVFFAVHILVVDYFAPHTDGVCLSCIQFLVCGVTCGVIALIVESPSWEQLRQGIIPLLYTGFMSSGVAYTLQIIGQKNFNPTIAAMIMSLESVISAVTGYLAYRLGWLPTDQSMTAVQILGCLLMLVSVIFVQLPFDKMRRTHR